MKIAITSQNRKSITEHAGRCRNFWVFHTGQESILEKELLELSKEQSFHESDQGEPHPLDDIDVLIAGDMGQGLLARLERKGIKGLVTTETDPEKAVMSFLQGTLETKSPNPHHHGNK
ncbi:MAG: nitrogen fixation protein [Gammaproteobacteria bacterium]|nr:nitrogen fixation protein [Gammaproteobacteria bacterium]